MRMWRILQMKKRAGLAHGMGKLVPVRRPGELRVMCPACPEPGFNMDMSDALNVESDKVYVLPRTLVDHLSDSCPAIRRQSSCPKITYNPWSFQGPLRWQSL